MTIRKAILINITQERPLDGDYFVVEGQEGDIIHKAGAVSDDYLSVFGTGEWYDVSKCWKVTLELNPTHTKS